ncbi:MAG: hypothetical protein H6799_02465 [Candidatus Nomurabacteria bacterium]|nr:MAG: hypothetical protein H6799_02465 [Candidatus Nomurabacteria bacterium]HRV75844.1 hypothetical protein [Candidatus Saccharimonadales bacterium]
MTTDKLPDTNNTDFEKKDVNPPQHSSSEQVIKDSSIESRSHGFKKLKFIPESNSTKVIYLVAGFVGLILILLLILMLSGGGSSNKKVNQKSDPVVIKDLEANNNSEGYVDSAPANFGEFSLNLNFSQPELIKSQLSEVNLGQQVSWQDGFAILAASVDRDYRPASEYDYKKVAEAGDEFVRVNFLVGNASYNNMNIGYDDLALYAEGAGLKKTEPERMSDDTYSPRDGQILGGKQTQKISLHFRVKRGQSFYITKSKSFTQNNAKVKNGEEKKPILTLRINL